MDMFAFLIHKRGLKRKIISTISQFPNNHTSEKNQIALFSTYIIGYLFKMKFNCAMLSNIYFLIITKQRLNQVPSFSSYPNTHTQT